MNYFRKKTLLLAVLCMALSTGTYTAAYAQDESGTYVSGTKINQVGVAGMTPDQAKEMVEAFYNDSYSLTVTGKNGVQAVISGKDIGYRVEITGSLTQILEDQNAGGRISGPSVNNRYETAMSAVYDEAALEKQLSALPMVTDALPTSDASISSYNEKTGFVIIPESQGTELDMEKLHAAVKEALAAGRSSLDLDAAGCYRQITVRSDDPALNELLNAMNRCASMTITYQFGNHSETLNGSVIASWLTGGSQNGPDVRQDAVAAYVAELASKYDTAGTSRTFHTSRGTEVQLTGPYGWKIDQAAETAALTAAIAAGESVTREPVYSSQAASHDGADYGTTYVEVDIAGQHVYFYKDGQLAWEAPCVTGNLSKGYGTPDGIYGLYYKQEDKVLRGPKQADGTYEYESPVNYWMPFNGGIGLHDANWRGSFGGAIYKTNGSHGCVNLPPNKTKELYDYLYKNVPVICHS